MSDAVVTRELAKTYDTGRNKVRALAGVDLRVRKGEFVTISGPSGSGKSTLLHIIGGLDTPTSGRVEVLGDDLVEMGPDQLAEFRRDTVGFVFQFFNLIPSLTAGQNVAVPRMFGPGDPMGRARELMERVGLADRFDHRPSELSGGEMQRTAVARALMNDPPIILADEPTGNLDSSTGEEILSLFRELNREGKTVMIVTHEAAVAGVSHRRLEIVDGLIGPKGPRVRGKGGKGPGGKKQEVRQKRGRGRVGKSDGDSGKE